VSWQTSRTCGSRRASTNFESALPRLDAKPGHRQRLCSPTDDRGGAVELYADANGDKREGEAHGVERRHFVAPTQDAVERQRRHGHDHRQAKAESWKHRLQRLVEQREKAEPGEVEHQMVRAAQPLLLTQSPIDEAHHVQHRHGGDRDDVGYEPRTTVR
jgi:hypothetical protein